MADISVNSKQGQSSEQDIVSEIHNYLRHDTQLWLQWFCFYVPLNYIAIGWVATQKMPQEALDLIAAIFIAQGVLGMIGSLMWAKRLRGFGRSLVEAYRQIPNLSMPKEPWDRMYLYSIYLCVTALFVLVIAWIVMIRIFPDLVKIARTLSCQLPS